MLHDLHPQYCITVYTSACSHLLIFHVDTDLVHDLDCHNSQSYIYTLELVDYQYIIPSANHSLPPLSSWLQYNGQFCTLVASNCLLHLNKHHQELW